MDELTPEQELVELEKQKEKYQEDITFADRVERLLGNADFKAIILDRFITKEAAALVHVSTDINVREDIRRDALAAAQATGYLKRWLMIQTAMGNKRRDELPELDETIEELRAEAVNGEKE